MATYFRLNYTPNELPTHWAYGEPWELYQSPHDGSFELHENRCKGFQVWASLPNVIVASAGWHLDGDYDDYPFFLTLESDDCEDGSGEWYCVDDVANVRCCGAGELVRWCVEQSECGLDLEEEGNQEPEFDALRDWIEANEDEVREWIEKHSKSVEVERVDTLPCPEAYQSYRD